LRAVVSKKTILTEIGIDLMTICAWAKLR